MGCIRLRRRELWSAGPSEARPRFGLRREAERHAALDHADVARFKSALPTEAEWAQRRAGFQPARRARQREPFRSVGLYLFRVAFAPARGARPLRRFRVGQFQRHCEIPAGRDSADSEAA